MVYGVQEGFISIRDRMRCNIQLYVWQGEEDELKSAPNAVKETITRPAQEFQQIGPTKQINQFIALGSVLVAVGLFASARLDGGGVPGLSQLTLQAVPYEEVRLLCTTMRRKLQVERFRTSQFLFVLKINVDRVATSGMLIYCTTLHCTGLGQWATHSG